VDDYALLVGLSAYPALGEGGKVADLKGPPFDVRAVRDWLQSDPNGPQLDDQHVFVVESVPPTSYVVPAIGGGGGQLVDKYSMKPSVSEVESLVKRLADLADQRAAAGERYIGRRLYIYMSGHGFSPERMSACLYVGSAGPNSGDNVHATGWLRQLQDRGYFQEYVLLMDCCMDSVWWSAKPKDPLSDTTPSDAPRATFIAFAAQRPKRAVAVAMPTTDEPDRMLGAFTWAVVEGLKGAAADRYGRVTGRSLANWVRNAQPAVMTPADLGNPGISQEPDVLQEDSGLIFVKGVSKPRYPVLIQCPDAVTGSKAVVWSGTPAYAVEEFQTGPGGNTLSLEPGLYCVDVPDAGLRQGFEVLSPSMPREVVVRNAWTHGAAVAPPRGTLYSLELSTRDEDGASIYVIDSTFECIEKAPRSLASRLPFGVYKFKSKLQRNTFSEVFLLDRDTPGKTIDTPRAVTVAPSDEQASSTSHEYHLSARSSAVNELANSRGARDVDGKGTSLLLLARTFSAEHGEAFGDKTQPWVGVKVVNAAGKVVLDLEERCTKDDWSGNGRDPLGWDVAFVAPGAYYLRMKIAEGWYEQSLIVSPGYRHEVYVFRRLLPNESELKRPSVSVFLYPPDAGLPNSADEVRLEIARCALADEQQILSPGLETFLFDQSSSPMARLLGGQLLLIERIRDPARSLERLAPAVRRLNEELGPGHPDVAALALQCADTALHDVGRLVGPPMFQRSWDLLSQAAHERPGLIPAAMVSRVLASSTLPPFLIWSIEAEARQAVRNDLMERLGEAEVPMAAPRQTMGFGAATVDVQAVRKMVAPATRDREKKRALAKMRLPPSALSALRRR